MATRSLKFTKSALTALAKENIFCTVRDTEVSGLKCKFGKKRVVFQFEKRISQRSGKKSSPVTFTLGAFPSITVEDARQQAREIATLCEKGIDPREKKKQELVDATPDCLLFRDAIEKFFEVKQELSTLTLKTYRQVVKYNFPKLWLSMNMLDITPEMLAEQFHLIRQTQRSRCWKYLKVFGNIWNTCLPFFKNANGERILGQNPIPEVRNLLKNVKPDQLKRTVIPADVLGKYVVTLERLRSGEIPFSSSVHPSRLMGKRLKNRGL